MIDPGITAAETAALRAAIATETIPSHLFGFASALAPDHCAAASLLHARGALLEHRRALDPRVLAEHLLVLRKLAFEPVQRMAAPQGFLGARQQLDALAASLRVPAPLLYRMTRQTAGEMVVDENATFADIPHAIVTTARALLVAIGPVRIVDPARVVLALPSTVHLTSRAEADDRARWVRHYAREGRLAMEPRRI